MKDPEIKHFIRLGKYICNSAVSATPEKSVKIKKKVNCRNCKVILNGERK